MKGDARSIMALALIALFSHLSDALGSSSADSQFTEPAVNMEFLSVPAGCFQMGDRMGNGNDDERPVHKVCVDRFYIGTYEVTQGQYEAIMAANPSRFIGGAQFPVDQVSWNDAQEFITRLNEKTGRNYRLPTEAEWEYAARSGGKNEQFAGSNEPDGVAWYWHYHDDLYSSKEVGSKMANGLGIHDMSGNVWEWCSDWYARDYYQTSSTENPAGPSSGSTRVARGGGWNNHPWHMRVTFRAHSPPDRRIINVGFRLAHAVP